MLHGLCNTKSSWNLTSSSSSSSSTSATSDQIIIPPVNDSDVKLTNAIQWIESILESHYKSFIFASITSNGDNSNNNSNNSNDNNNNSTSIESQPFQYVFKSLLCLHEILNGIDDAVDLTELTSGIVLHLRRVMKYQKSSQRHSYHHPHKPRQLQPNQQMIVRSKNNVIEYNENYQLEVVQF